jgi:hypothetical protein
MKMLKIAALLALLATAASVQAQAAQITITGTVTDANGSAPFSVTVTTDQVAITSATVVPAVAPSGTSRTLTIIATSSAGLALQATLNAVAGITFLPLTGQPAGTFVWTFVY